MDGADGSAFAAPSLVVHYVIEHGYCPPQAFRTAVLDYARFYGFQQTNRMETDGFHG